MVVVGIFDDFGSADVCLTNLKEAGFEPKQIVNQQFVEIQVLASEEQIENVKEIISDHHPKEIKVNELKK
jgi:hypothetical protein